jgi:hypothetical protein
VRESVHRNPLVGRQVGSVLGVQRDRHDVAVEGEPGGDTTRRSDVDDPETVPLSHLDGGIRLLAPSVQIHLIHALPVRVVPPPDQDVVRPGIEALTLGKDQQRSVESARELVDVVEVGVVDEGAGPHERKAIGERVPGGDGGRDAPVGGTPIRNTVGPGNQFESVPVDPRGDRHAVVDRGVHSLELIEDEERARHIGQAVRGEVRIEGEAVPVAGSIPILVGEEVHFEGRPARDQVGGAGRHLDPDHQACQVRVGVLAIRLHRPGEPDLRGDVE